MKIYHCVESYYPSVGGMQEVVKQLSERLVSFGHDVTVLTRHSKERKQELHNGVKISQFMIEGNPAIVTTKSGKEYVDFLLNGKPDVITFFAAQQWATDLALPILSRIKAKRVSVPTGYSGLFKEEYKEYFQKMKEFIHHYDMNVYLGTNYRDINFARSNNVGKMVVIPNAASEEEFGESSKINVRQQLGLPEHEFIVLHVGSYTGRKGHRECYEIFSRSKLENATLLMIGNDHKTFYKQFIKYPRLLKYRIRNVLSKKKRVIFKYFSRDFTVAAYQQADIFLFPSNIECSPIVLFECAAAKLPFIASDAGNSAEICQWTGGGVIIPSVHDSEGYTSVNLQAGVDLLNSFYDDEEGRKKLGSTAAKVWKEKYTWGVIAHQYEKLYKDLLHDNS